MKLVNIHKQISLFPKIGFIFLFFSSVSYAQSTVWTLQACIDSAKVANKSLQMAKNQQAIGQVRIQEAKANYLPKISLSADYRYFTNLPYQLMPLSVFNGAEGKFKEAQFGVPHNIGASVQLLMPLYDPQISGAIQSTQIASDLSSWQYQKSEEQLVFELSNAYYNAQILHHQLAFIESNLNNAQKLLATVQVLQNQGLAKGTEVSKVKLQESQLKTQKALINSKLSSVFSVLKFLMGKNQATPLQIETEIKVEEKANYLVQISADQKIVQTHNRLLNSELATLRKSKLPKLSLVGNYGLTGFGYTKIDPFLKFFPMGFVGLQLSQSIWNGTTRKKIAQKELEIRNNVLQTAMVREQEEMQIANANLQKAVMQENSQTIYGQIALAQSIYDQTLLQQKQGTATIVEVLLADNALREAQQNYLNSLVEYLKADLELKKASSSLQN